MEDAGKEGMLFLKDKQARLLFALASGNKEWHLADLAKTARVTYIHTSRFIGRCEAAGLVATERHGRIKRLYLTDKGKNVANGMLAIVNSINERTEAGEGVQQ